jgi:mono/diheme cytochrome c family protein
MNGSAQLTAVFQSGEKSDHRIDRLPALFVEKGEVPSAFLPAGAFATTWTGKLKLTKRQRLIFSFEGTGEAVLSIDGKEILSEKGTLGTARSEQTRINPGEHDFSLHYKSIADGSARIRLFWEETSFPRQSLPAIAFARTEDAETTAAMERRRGRELFATSHCAKCHQPEQITSTDPMQEMVEIAPLLINAGNRLNEAWLRQWLTTPETLRPGTPMPSLFDREKPETAQQVADLATFLATMKIGDAATASTTATEAQILAGGAHFHQLGCAACHSKPDQSEPDTEHDRIPLNNVAAKFQPGALTEFLKDPSAYAPHRGMPNFQLNEEERSTLSAYLTAKSKPTIPMPVKLTGDATRGAELAKANHCGSCHAGLPMPEKPTTSSLEKIFAADWTAKGCVASAEKRGAAPRLHLTEADKTALIAFSKIGTSSLAHNDKAEAAERKFHSLRCDACHSRDASPALLDLTHAETKSLTAHIAGANEKLDQSRPHFTFIGEMLQASYMQSIISGTIAAKPRPWLEMRMPAFSAHANSLAEGFARLHGIDPKEKFTFTLDPSKVAIGADLTSADRGFGCTTCHGVGDIKPSAAFEVQGLNFDLTQQRIRQEWFSRWMDNPASVTPTTKMPQYAPNGQSPNPALDGKAADQFDAIWHYLQSLKK